MTISKKELKMKRTTKTWTAPIAVMAAVLIAAGYAYSGSLEPTTPPSSGGTMKTLDQVEPRIPIPGSTAAAGTYTISASGSYYLTGDRLCSGQGFGIYADNVTIDLCGYSLVGSGSSGSGITIYGRSNVEIRNGTIRSFKWHGIAENNTNDNAKNHSIIGIRVIGNGIGSVNYHGISLTGRNHHIVDCTAAENGGTGISVGEGSLVSNNTARSNGASGIHASIGCTVTANTSSLNGNLGISTGAGCTVTNNTVYSNTSYGIYCSGGTIKGNTSRANSLGIYAGEKSSVIGNTVIDNTGIGIYCSSNCLIDQNTSVGNGAANLSASGCTLGTNHAP